MKAIKKLAEEEFMSVKKRFGQMLSLSTANASRFTAEAERTQMETFYEMAHRRATSSWLKIFKF